MAAETDGIVAGMNNLKVVEPLVFKAMIERHFSIAVGQYPNSFLRISWINVIFEFLYPCIRRPSV